jgi:hypothetical protein
MIPLGAIKYIIQAGVFVVSFFVAMRLIFASTYRREGWRTDIRRFIYFKKDTFNRISFLLGWVFLLISLLVGWFIVDDLLK